MRAVTRNQLEQLAHDLEQIAKEIEREENTRATFVGAMDNGHRSNAVLERDNATIELSLACKKASTICRDIVWLDSHYALGASPETFLSEARDLEATGQRKVEDLRQDIRRVVAARELSR